MKGGLLLVSVAICDSNGDDLNFTAAQVRAGIVPSDSGNLRVDTFLRPFDLFEALEKGGFYDIYILETNLPGLSGIDTAKYLRERGIAKPVIFVTYDRNRALDAFGVDAMQYLLKPLKPEKLFSALDHARIFLRTERRQQIVFKTADGFRHVFFRNILFSETDGKYQCIHTEFGEVLRVRTTASGMASALCAHPGYARCGSSYTLNLYHVRRFDSKNVEMSDGSLLPVPRGAYAKLNDAYKGYFRSQ